MSYREIVRIGTQVAQALRESTQLDIVHGDIKPSNILIYEDVAKLSDFGLSHRISLPGSDSGRVAGTPNYMAPEGRVPHATGVEVGGKEIGRASL